MSSLSNDSVSVKVKAFGCCCCCRPFLLQLCLNSVVKWRHWASCSASDAVIYRRRTSDKKKKDFLKISASLFTINKNKPEKSKVKTPGRLQQDRPTDLDLHWRSLKTIRKPCRYSVSFKHQVLFTWSSVREPFPRLLLSLRCSSAYCEQSNGGDVDNGA